MAVVPVPQRSPVVSTEVLTDEQCQRILAVRVAREVIETRQQAGPLVAAATEFDGGLLLVVAQWIMSGSVGPITEELQELQQVAEAGGTGD